MVEADDPSAIRWCLWGATMKVYKNIQVRKRVFRKIGKGMSGSATVFNDSHTHKEVLEFVKRIGI